MFLAKLLKDSFENFVVAVEDRAGIRRPEKPSRSNEQRPNRPITDQYYLALNDLHAENTQDSYAGNGRWGGPAGSTWLSHTGNPPTTPNPGVPLNMDNSIYSVPVSAGDYAPSMDPSGDVTKQLNTDLTFSADHYRQYPDEDAPSRKALIALNGGDPYADDMPYNYGDNTYADHSLSAIEGVGIFAGNTNHVDRLGRLDGLSGNPRERPFHDRSTVPQRLNVTAGHDGTLLQTNRMRTQATFDDQASRLAIHNARREVTGARLRSNANASKYRLLKDLCEDELANSEARTSALDRTDLDSAIYSSIAANDHSIEYHDRRP